MLLQSAQGQGQGQGQDARDANRNDCLRYGESVRDPRGTLGNIHIYLYIPIYISKYTYILVYLPIIDRVQIIS